MGVGVPVRTCVCVGHACTRGCERLDTAQCRQALACPGLRTCVYDRCAELDTGEGQQQQCNYAATSITGSISADLFALIENVIENSVIPMDLSNKLYHKQP